MTPIPVPGTDAAGTSPSLDELAILRADFPCFRIWREETCDRAVNVACSLHLELNPYTVVTDDISELSAALEPAGFSLPRPHPAGQAPSVRPLPATAP
jgi:hypothetical protein